MLSRKGEPSSELTTFLSHGFMDWVRNHFAVPIDWGGDTAEFQFWYQQALFACIRTMANLESSVPENSYVMRERFSAGSSTSDRPRESMRAKLVGWNDDDLVEITQNDHGHVRLE